MAQQAREGGQDPQVHAVTKAISGDEGLLASAATHTHTAKELLQKLGDTAHEEAKQSDDDRAFQARTCARELLQELSRFEAHSQALRDLETQFTPSSSTGTLFDFQGELERLTNDHFRNAPNIDDRAEMRRITQLVKSGRGEELQDDEDVRLEGSAGTDAHLVNRECPLTQRDVMSLNEPLQDQAGCIFEGQAIRDYIRKRRGKQVACPRSDRHYVTLQTLEQATDIQREQERHAYATQRAARDDDL